MTDQAQGLRHMMESHAQLGTRVIAVTSGKGGVGKTNLAVNLAIEMAQRGLRVGLLDADMGLANVDIVLGIVPKFTLGDVIYGQKRLREVIIEGPKGIKVFAGGAGMYELANLSRWRLERFIRCLEELDSELDLMLIDTGAGISRNVLTFVLAAEEVIVLTTPEPTSITDAYGIIKIIAGQETKDSISVVVNMANSKSHAESVFNKLDLVVEKFLASRLEYAGYLPVDAAITRAVASQKPFRLLYPHSKASLGVISIADKLLGDSKSAGGLSRFIGRMANILGKSIKR